MENYPLVSLTHIPKDPIGTEEGAVVPVVFGEVRVPANMLLVSDVETSTVLTKLQRYGDMVQAYLAAVWYAICMGKIAIENIFANDKQLTSGIDYDLTNFFNDGTGAFKPTPASGEALVKCGAGGVIYSTLDRVVWTLRASGTVSAINDIVFANEMFVAVCTSGEILTSPDGLTWVIRNSGSALGLNAITYGNGLFVAVGGTGGVNKITTSPDGINWTLRSTAGTTKLLNDVCFSGAFFVAVGNSAGIAGLILTSPDGITWTSRVSNTIENILTVDYGNSKFVAGTACSYATLDTLVSTNGITWARTNQITMMFFDIYSICFGVGYFILASNYYFYRSTDGVAWTMVYNHTPTNTIAHGIYDTIMGVFRLVCRNGEHYTSVNGALGTWTYLNSGFVANSITYNTYANNYDYATKLAGVAHIWFPGIEAGSSDFRVVFDNGGTAPDMRFQVRLDLSTSLVTTPNVWRQSGGVDSVFLGSNPAAAIHAILTNAQWGLGVAAANINLSTFNDVAVSFTSSAARAAERLYGVNIFWNESCSAREVIDKICETCDLLLYVKDDKFCLRNMYLLEADILGTLLDDDFESLAIERQTWDDVDNVFLGEFIDRSNNFAKKIFLVKNDAGIAMAGGFEKRRSVDLTYFVDATVASVRLHEIMQRESKPRIPVSCTVNRRWSDALPGDVINVISAEYGLIGVYEVVSVGLGGIDDMTVSLKLVPKIYNDYDTNYTEGGNGLGTVPVSGGGEAGVEVENLTFPQFTYLSTARSVAFVDDTLSQVQWGSDQVLTGMLVYGTDYTVVGGTQIQLTAKWIATVQANFLGLLNIDVWE